MKTIKRNGDWNIVSTDEKIKGETIKHKGSFIFATGEATNHHHVITVEKPQDMILTKMADGSYLVELKSEATITHPEHSLKVDIKIKKGTYKLFQRREKDWFSLSTRKIVD